MSNFGDEGAKLRGCDVVALRIEDVAAGGWPVASAPFRNGGSYFGRYCILNTAIAVIGIDIGKNLFHVVGHDARGAIVAAKVVAWPSGSATRQYTALPDRNGSLRKLASLGHDAGLMPAKYVRPYSKGRRTTSMMPKRLPKPCSAPR